MQIYLTDKEAQCLREVAGQWIELMETSEEDLVTPMLNDGLGSALAKLYKGKNGYTLFVDFVKKEGGKHGNLHSEPPKEKGVAE